MNNKPYIKTKVEKILRVMMYAPRGFRLPLFGGSLLSHDAFRSLNPIKMEKDLIYYIIEFEDISSRDEKKIRKFCRDVMKNEMVTLKEYERQKKFHDKKMKDWHKKLNHKISAQKEKSGKQYCI